MSKLRVAEADFLQIKNNLKDFLRGQDQFKDFDFEGSGINIILDILAYNTLYKTFYLNMVGSEMFLDSAQLRESVVSIAKEIGYTPTSKKSAAATVDIEIFPTDAPANILVPKNKLFVSKIDSRLFTFRLTKAYNVSPDIDNRYLIEGATLEEGVPLTHTFTVDSGIPDQRFILPNSGVDLDSLFVTVQKSETKTSQQIFVKFDDINDLTGDDAVYFVQEVHDQLHEIYFGDGVVGKAVEDGNLIIVDYVVSKGALANKANSFEAVQKFHPTGTHKITVTQTAIGGVEEEPSDSVRRLAPLSYEAQNRAVTKSDYEILVKKDFPEIEAVRVWGGEENDPPQYGRVFISLKPFGSFEISESDKELIVNKLVRQRNLVSIEVIAVDPDFTFIVPTIEVKYTSAKTSKTPGQIQNDVIETVKTFGNENLNIFDSFFRYSKLTKAIDDTDQSILNNLTDIKLKKRFEPSLFIPQQHTLKFNNPIDRGDSCNDISSVTSTGFLLGGLPTFIADDGQGSLFFFRNINNQRVIVKKDIGTVDYETGEVLICAFQPEAIVDEVDYIEVTVIPEDNDVIPLRNQILFINEEDISVSVEDEIVDANILT